MLLRAIAGIDLSYRGQDCRRGKELHKDISFPESVGVIIETTSLLPQFDAYTNLKHLAEIKSCVRRGYPGCAGQVGLGEERKRVRAYSLGMRQKLAIAQAVLKNRSCCFWTSPPTRWMRRVWKRYGRFCWRKGTGAVIILASHNREDMAYLCDQMVYMADGKITDGVRV